MSFRPVPKNAPAFENAEIPQSWSLDKALGQEVARLAEQAETLQSELAESGMKVDADLMIKLQSLDALFQSLSAISALLINRSVCGPVETARDWEAVASLSLKSLAQRLTCDSGANTQPSTSSDIELF